MASILVRQYFYIGVCQKFKQPALLDFDTPSFALYDREIYECLSGSFPTFYLVVSGKKRNFAVKQIVELNKWPMKQVEERYEAKIAKFTPQEMREYEASKMAYRDIKNSIDTATQKGFAEGMEKGMNQKTLDIARNMLADGVDINLIRECKLNCVKLLLL